MDLQVKSLQSQVSDLRHKGQEADKELAHLRNLLHTALDKLFPQQVKNPPPALDENCLQEYMDKNL